jgi:hypothetical protein
MCLETANRKTEIKFSLQYVLKLTQHAGWERGIACSEFRLEPEMLPLFLHLILRIDYYAFTQFLQDISQILP